MPRILTIEDDPTTAQEIVRELERRGFEVNWAADGEMGLRLARAGGYDAITLDRMLPGVDGVTIAQVLKAENIDTPILMISALSDIDERVRGLREGGDDYLTKPFALEEMAARVEVLLRRSRTDLDKRVLMLGDLELDLVGHVARRNGRDLKLAPKELRLLEVLMRNSGQVLTRTMIFEMVWGYTFDPGTNLIDVYIRTLRSKLEAPDLPVILHTIRGSGYRLAVE